MNIDLQTVRQMFEDVLSGRISREEADRWAYALVKEDEARTLIYSPRSDRDRIFAGIMYLYGVDLKDSPNSYLHSEDDIRTAMEKKLGK
jgi:hypothetical protein